MNYKNIHTQHRCEEKATYEKTEKLIFETRLDNYVSDCVYAEDGLECVKCSWPFAGNNKPKIVKGKQRERIIKNLAIDLYYLNPYNSLGVRNVVLSFNKKYCDEPLPLRSIDKMLFQIMERKVLRPTKTKLKHFWVNPECKDKRKAFLKKSGQIRKEHTIDKIDFFFEEELCYFDKKLTQDFIAKQIRIGIRTLRRWITQEQKDILKGYNSTFNKR